MNLLAKIIKRIYYLFRYSVLAINSQDQKTVFLDVGDHTSRRIQELFILFGLDGYTVYCRVRLRFKTVHLFGLIDDYKNLKFIWRNPIKLKCAVLIAERDFSFKKGIKVSKIIKVSFDCSPKLKDKPGHFMMPIPMHKNMYVKYFANKKIDTYRSRKRKLRIIFSGNYSKDYHNKYMRDVCGKLSRYEIVEYFKQNKIITLIRSPQEFSDLLKAEYSNRFVLLDKTAGVDQSKWLETLAQADFLVSLTGTDLPWAHSAVEAMSVGTIPIVNFPEWFFPNLTNNLNCLSFDSFEGAADQLNKALFMNDSDIFKLRGEVIKYYDSHLRLDKFLKKLMNCQEKEIYLHAHPDHPREYPQNFIEAVT